MLQQQSKAPPLKVDLLNRVVTKLDRKILYANLADSAFTRWRLILFMIGAICTVTFYTTAMYHVGNVALFIFIILFFIIVIYHNTLESHLHRFHRWKQIKLTHLARLRLDWDHIPARLSTAPEEHPYAKDLNLVGPHSLLHLLDTTVSFHGHVRLRSWILEQPPDLEEWTRRRALVQELIPRSLFRDRLELEAYLIGEPAINGQRLEALLYHPIVFPHLKIILGVQTLLALVTMGLGISALLSDFPNYWMWPFATYALLYLQIDQGEELLEQAVGLHLELEKLGTVLEFVERYAKSSHGALASVWAPLLVPEINPPRLIQKAAYILHAISIKAHPVIHLMINAFCPWDLWFTYRLQRIQAQGITHLPTWIDKLAEVEAASALATFAALHPSYVWPRLLSTASNDRTSQTPLSAINLAHPLIPETRRVPNDLAFETLETVLLLTGSNMSGKSTFLRTLGINLCLAQAGAPICGTFFEWTWIRLVCCIRVDDSLEAGLSHFYAEIKQLKRLLNEATDRKQPPVFFLIDEIFKGTNNRERLIGVRSFITALSKANSFGLVTTHDLELIDLEKTIPRLRNAHFQETMEAGTLLFDYKLRPGPCLTTNALRIMEIEGLPVQRPLQTELL